MASKFEVEDIYVPHADGVHHDRYRHSSSGWYFVSPSGKVSSKRVSQALAIVLDWAKQNRLDHEYFVQTVMMNMGTLNMALSGQPVELKRGEPGWTPELDNIRELRAQLAEAEGQARGSEAMLIQTQRDCDNAQNAELVALSQLAEMTKALDASIDENVTTVRKALIRGCGPADTINGVVAFTAIVSLLAERDAALATGPRATEEG